MTLFPVLPLLLAVALAQSLASTAPPRLSAAFSVQAAVRAAAIGAATALASGPKSTAGGGASTRGARAVPARAAPARGWAWPLAPKPAVLRGFDPPDRPWLSGHRGVDLRAGAGAVVSAPAPGRVSFAGVVVDRPVLTIDHGDGLRSSFEPVETSLRAGDPVAAGSPVGAVAAAQSAPPGHCGGTPCLHWGVRSGEEYLNPLGFVLDL